MKSLAFLLALAFSITQLRAQAPSAPAAPATPATASFPIWRCQLPGGTYDVALRSIMAVSQHEYLLEGGARITEVNVDTAGTLLARFYFIEPAVPNVPVGTEAVQKAQQLLTEAADRTGQDAWKKVVKSYPTTTHARTVEYRLVSKDQLQQLFASADTAFRTGKGAVFSAE